MKSNILSYVLNVLGNDIVRDAIHNARSANNKNRLVQVTNPFLQYLARNTIEDASGKVTANPINSGFDIPRMHFVLCGSLLMNLKKEIIDNNSYKKEVARGLLSLGSFPYYSQLNELIVAGFYRFLDKDISFNESNNGLPDVEVAGEHFASDAKIFKNNRIALDIAINESKNEIERAFELIKDENLTIYMLTHEIGKLRASLAKFSRMMAPDSFTAFRDDNCIVARHDSSQDPEAVKLLNEESNLLVSIKANWPMDEAVKEYRNTITKATNQAKKAKKKAVPWILFLDDGNRHAGEMTVIRVFGNFHLDFIRDLDIDKVINYSFSLNGNGKFTVVIDVFEQGSNKIGINQVNFEKYIRELLSFKEIVY